jgi:hypothetical protein
MHNKPPTPSNPTTKKCTTLGGFQNLTGNEIYRLTVVQIQPTPCAASDKRCGAWPDGCPIRLNALWRGQKSQKQHP